MQLSEMTIAVQIQFPVNLKFLENNNLINAIC